MSSTADQKAESVAPAAPPHPSGMSAEERFSLIRSVGEECIQDEELRKMIANKPTIRCYDGFEPSGRMHIAQGIFKAVNVNKCTTVGCEFVFWVADWFALMNDKMGGELERIRTVGKYLVEVWSAAGMNMENVKFLWSSDEINSHAEEYWKRVLDIARRNSLARIKKCCTIMGKKEGDLSSAQILYPLMQCADIFFLKADICQLGKDQRKVNALARDYCDSIGRKLKPVILSHHMLSGLKKGQAKMSKSDPDSAIFMEDSAEDVARKINAAYCPRVAQKAPSTGADDSGLPDADDDVNPVLDYVQCIILNAPGSTMPIKGKDYDNYAAVEKDFLDGVFEEEELKGAVIDALNNLLEPVRNHFTTNENAAKLLAEVKELKKLPPAEKPQLKAPECPRAVAFLPATLKLPLSVIIDIVDSFKEFLEANPGAKATLVLPDWTAMVQNAITGEDKDIVPALEYGKRLVMEFGLPSEVEVIRQQDFILSNPDQYWVSVISVGRRQNLGDIEKGTGPIENAGQVVGALMRATDAELLGATHLITLESDGQLNTFVENYSEQRIKALPLRPTSVPFLCSPTGKPTRPEDTLFADDTDMDLGKKVKQAYCAEKEAANPVIDLLRFFVVKTGKVQIAVRDRDPLEFAAPDAVSEAAASGALHPGDAKAALKPLILSFTEKARAAVKTPEMKKYATALKNAEKKLAKKK